MNSSNANVDLNRPVYLGWRDAFIEKILARLPKCLADLPAAKRLGHIDDVLDYLQAAQEATELANLSTAKQRLDAALAIMLQLIFCYLRSARTMLASVSQFNDPRNPLRTLLQNAGPLEADVDPAAASIRLLKDAERLFQLLQKPFEDLRQANIDALGSDERERYQRAYKSIKARRRPATNIKWMDQLRPNFLASSWNDR